MRVKDVTPIAKSECRETLCEQDESESTRGLAGILGLLAMINRNSVA